jgi:5-formyltetrahydrofolate cyclo-ligase
VKSDPAAKAVKKALRASTIQAIRSLDSEARQAQESDLLDGVRGLPGWGDAKTVLLYVKAFDEEIETLPLITGALDESRRVVCPRVERAAHRLDLFVVEDPARDLEPGVLGIPEPRRTCRAVEPGEIDWALVPGLVFNPRGYRIGRGAGHYDRLLPKLRPKVETWAIAFDCQVVDPIPVEPHDVAVRGVLTPSGRITARA